MRGRVRFWKAFRWRRLSTPSRTFRGLCRKAATCTARLQRNDVHEPAGGRVNTLASHYNLRPLFLAESWAKHRYIVSILSWRERVLPQTRHRSKDALGKAYRALEQNPRARAEARRDRRVRFGPSPNLGLRESNHIPSTSRQSLRTEYRLVRSATIPLLAPWSLRLPRVCQRGVVILPATTAQRWCRLYSTPANALRP